MFTLTSSPSSDIHSPDEPDPVELALVDATEKIAYLKESLEEAIQKEEKYLTEIADLRNELAEAIQKEEKYLTEITDLRDELAEALAVDWEEVGK